mmetsp:Transcript_24622/g.93076  ORF Transcript_24622/g.93076 Transcript_24622/m.93076 type:complete len:101 (-) Transcript_24622:114-416(-)
MCRSELPADSMAVASAISLSSDTSAGLGVSPSSNTMAMLCAAEQLLAPPAPRHVPALRPATDAACEAEMANGVEAALAPCRAEDPPESPCLGARHALASC